MKQLHLLDLFSGIGGFSLGLERTGGFETVAFCEIEPFPRKILAKHWPEVPCYEDIRELTAERLATDGVTVDAICGGFPCQDISTAGKGACIEGERSGLWSEYARLIGELRPRVVFVENVAALLSRGLGKILGDLAALGYDAEWHCIPASAVGAPHRRDRIWILAYPEGEYSGCRFCEAETKRDRNQPGNSGSLVADTYCRGRAKARANCAATGSDGAIGNAWWLIEPNVGRVAHGVPDRVDRLAGLGNGLVPKIPELLGRFYLGLIKEGKK